MLKNNELQCIKIGSHEMRISHGHSGDSMYEIELFIRAHGHNYISFLKC